MTTAITSTHRQAVIGSLTIVGALLACNVARPASAQTLDPTFAPSLSDTVRTVAMQPDGHIVVGGDFRQVSGQPRPFLARLRADGTVASAPAMPDNRVEAIAVQADGKMIIGGDFETVGGVPRHYVARLLPDGQIDPVFQPAIGYNAGIHVTHVAVHANGTVMVAGGFDSVSGQPRPGLARLQINGSLDASFNPPPIAHLLDAMALQPDGKVVLAGSLDEVSDDCDGYCVLRLTANGSLDASFDVVPVIGSVRHLALQNDGGILVAGNFGYLGNHDTAFVGRLTTFGGPDYGFSNTALRYSDIARIVPLPDGRSIIAGEIRWGTTGPTVDRVARLKMDGSRDLSFAEPDLDNMIFGSALQPDMYLLVAGAFNQVAGQPRARLARLRVADVPDAIFANGFDGSPP